MRPCGEGVKHGDLSVLLVEDSPLLVERLNEMLREIDGVHLAGVVDNETGAVTQ